MSAALTPEALDCPMRIGFDEARALLGARLLPRLLGIETVPLEWISLPSAMRRPS